MEEGLVAEAAAALCSKGNAYAKATEFEHSDGGLDAEVAAARHLNGDMIAAGTEFEHAEEKLVENDTATCHSNTNAAAATCNMSEDTYAAAFKAKAKRR